nr:helix-turn-helix transcriptional regulator [Allomuricauda sp.]
MFLSFSGEDHYLYGNLVHYTALETYPEKNPLEALGDRIRQLRLQKGMRQNEVARRCGFYKSGLNSIEAGKRNISVMTLYKIAHVLGEPVASFFQTGDTGEQ